jgi:hypothetical protein
VPFDEERFYHELVTLRQRRALTDLDVAKRLGAALRLLCGVVADDDDSALVRKTASTLTGLASALPKDQRTAVMIALGLRDGFDQPTYGQRILAARSLLDREEKAVRRRVEEGFRQLARRAAEAAAPQAIDMPGGQPETRWRTESLIAALSLESPMAEAFEHRTVVVLTEGLTELDLAISVPSDASGQRRAQPKELTVDVFRGGTLIGRTMESSDRAGLLLRLPRPLNIGDRHDVALRYRAKLLYPHYACTPRYPCDWFDVSVRFGGTRPSAVYQLDAAFQDDARDTSARGAEVEVDAAGEVHTTFKNLLPGFTYGVRWTWPD